MGFADHYYCKTMEYQREVKFTICVKEMALKPVYKMVDTCAAEFESYNTLLLQTYEEENESIVTDERKCNCIRFRSDPYWSRN